MRGEAWYSLTPFGRGLGDGRGLAERIFAGTESANVVRIAEADCG